MPANLAFKIGHQDEILEGSITSTIRATFGDKYHYSVGDRVEVLAGKAGDFVSRRVRVTYVKDTKLAAVTRADLVGGTELAKTPAALAIMLKNAHETNLSPHQAVQVVRFEYLD